MAINGGRIEYTIGYNVDNTGFQSIKTQLQNLMNIKSSDFLNLNPDLSGLNKAQQELTVIQEDVKQLQTAYEGAFDSTTGIVNINKLSNSLKGMDLNKIYSSFKKLGPEGVKAFNDITNQVTKVNLKFKETNNFLTKIGETLTNTIKWGIASSALNKFTGTVQQAWGYVQHLDTSLNDIRIVTEKSADEMDKFAEKANNAAKALGSSTTEYTEAALIYYQQGLSDEESQARAETTIKAANVTGQSAQAVSEQLTSVWNGYKVTAEETELYVDKLAAVAASTAADLEELSTGMSKVASAANNMGVDIDQLNAQLATIVSVTRQAPETAGTALKTIYARMEDLKIGGEDESGVKLGEVSSTLEAVGVSVMDTQGDLRDLGEVIEEVAGKWDTWTSAQQNAIAQALAGKRQYNNLLALFDNWDMYTDALETSKNAMGTLQKQQDIYMESTEAHLQQLKTAQEGLYDSLLNTDDVNSILDVITAIVEKFEVFIDSIGGGKNLLLGLVGTLGQIPGISTSISNAIGDMVVKTANASENTLSWNTWLEGIESSLAEDTSAYETQKELLDGIKSTTENLSLEERKRVIEQMRQLKILGAQKDVLEAQQNKAATVVQETAMALDNDVDQDESPYQKYEEADFNDLLSKEDISNIAEMFEAQQQAIEGAKQELENYIKKLQEIIELKNQYGNNAKYSKEFGELEEIQSRLEGQLNIIHPSAAGEVDKVVNKLEKVNMSLRNGDASAEELQKDLKTIGVVGSNSFKTVEKTQQEVFSTLEKGNEELDKAKGNFNKAADSAKSMVDNMSADRIGQSVTRLVSGFSSLAFSMQAIKNIGNIWNNEDLTAGEKLFQTVTALATSLPMLLTGFSSVTKGTKELQGSLTYINDIITKSTEVINQRKAAAIANNIVKQQEVTISEENAVAETTETEAKIANEAATEGEIATSEVNTATKETEAGANIAEAGAEDVDTAAKATNEVTTGVLIQTIGAHIAARLTEKVTILGVTAALGAYLAVAAGAVAIIAGIVYAVNKHEQAVRDANNAIIEQSNNTQEQINTNNELADSYLELYQRYKETGEVTEELKSAAKECTDTLDIQRGSVQLLAEDYDGLAESIKKAKAEENRKGVESAKKEKDAAEGNLLDSATDGLLNGEIAGQASISIGYGINTAEEKEAIQVLQSNLADTSADYFDQLWSGKIVTDYDAESILEVYDALVKTRDQLAAAGQQNTDVYKNISDWISKTTEDVEAYRAAVKDIETYATQLAGLEIDEKQIVDIESYAKIREDTIKRIKEETGIDDDERAANLADTWLSQNLGEEAKSYADQFNAASSLYEDYVNKIDGLTQEKVQEFISAMIENGSFKYQSSMTEEDWLNILGADNLEQAEVYMQGIIDRESENRIQNLKEQSAQYADAMQQLISSVNSGDLDYSNIAEDEGYQAIKENIDVLLEKFPELTDEATTFLQEGLVGTQDWINAAYDLEEAFSSLELELLNETLQDELDDISPNLDTDDFKKEMDEFLNADYAITVKVHSDGIKDFENAEEALDDIDEMASKIGDDFIVAADDIRELNNTFPGILDGMEYLADGTVQLNEEMVQSAMSMATEEELASANLTASKLEDTATELRAKADAYDNMAELAYQAAESSAKAEEAKTDIVSQLKQYETDTDEKVSNTKIDNSNLVADTSASDAQTLANNWTQAYQEASEAANSWADVAVAAQEYVDSGGKTQKSTFQVNYKGNYSGSSAKGNSASSANVENIDVSDSDSWKALGEELSAQAEAYRASANDLEGASAELRAKALGSANTNADAANGSSADSSGSGSSSADEADTEEYLEREEDLYKQINEQLDEVESTLSRIKTIDEHSWGINSKKALEEENELLKEQMTLYEHKNEVQKSDLADKQAELSAQGITFSDDGSVMTNTEDVLNSLYEEYNAMVDTYNAMNASEQETYKETLEAKKDSIDEIEDAIDSYEDAYNDYNDTLDDLLDTHYAIIENEVKQFTAEVEVHLELAEARNDWVDFWYDVVQDVEDTDFGKLIAKSMEKLDTYVGQEGTILSLTNEANIGLDEVQKQIANADNGGGDSIFGDDTELSKETLTTIRDNLIDAVTAAKEEIDNMSETYFDALDSIQDKLDEQAEGWENIGDHLNHNLEVLKLIDGEMAYDEINNQYQNILDNDEQLLEHRRNAATIWEQEIQKYQELIETTNEATNPELYRTYEQALEKATENYKDAVKDLDSSLESAIKNVQSKRDNLMEKTLDTLDKAISNGIGIDNIDAEWDLLIKDQDMYLDNVERAFNMDDINDAFDELLNTQDSSLSKQQDLLKFRDEELAKLNEKNKLTQYDIDELKARIEIRKQEIALEDAQRNKSNLRLRRDSQGNYTYQYTANEDEIDEAENGIMSAKKDWYELVKSRNKEVRDEIIQNIRDIYDVEKEYSKAIAEGDVATAQSLLRQKEMLLERQKALNVEAGKSTKDFYDGVVTYFEDVNNNTVLPMWQSDVSQMIDKWNNGGEDSFVGAVQAGITQLNSIQQEYLNNTEELFDAAGRSITDYRKDGIDPTTESLEDLQETNDDVNDSVQETIDLMDELGDALGEAEDAYNDLEASAVEAIEKINQTLKTLSETVVSTKKDMEDLSTASKQAATDVQNATNTKNTGSSGNPSNGGGIPTTTKTYELVKDPNGAHNTKGIRDTSTGKYVAIFGTKDNGEALLGENQKSLYKKLYNISLKSGGYTGSWNNGSDENNGKLAFLHQKELVLNESDTSNILNAVNSVRDLVNKGNSSIDHALANSLANAMTTQTRMMAEVGSQMLQAIASSVVNNNQVQNYRQMTVNADFSGVRSADAIYQALMNLDNYASQVAYSNAPDANRSY